MGIGSGMVFPEVLLDYWEMVWIHTERVVERSYGVFDLGALKKGYACSDLPVPITFDRLVR